ncbi:MAG TPA: HAD family hydrolase [Desulfuromonadales bacterium]|nr:HAD family hydrolase [Desulfuromonadales bacterium]
MKTTSRIEALFWDNDGILVDTEKLYFRASRETLAEAGIILTWDQFCDISLGRGQSVFDLAAQAGRSSKQCEKMRKERNLLYARLLRSETEVIDGVRETLETLYGTVPMAVVTSSLRDHFDIIHSGSDLLGFFDFILTREDYVHSKPHPEPYLTAVQKIGVPAHRCLVVEDSKRGLLSARRANIPCVIVGSAPDSAEFPGAWAVVPSVNRIPELLDHF